MQMYMLTRTSVFWKPHRHLNTHRCVQVHTQIHTQATLEHSKTGCCFSVVSAQYILYGPCSITIKSVCKTPAYNMRCKKNIRGWCAWMLSSWKPESISNNPRVQCVCVCCEETQRVCVVFVSKMLWFVCVYVCIALVKWIHVENVCNAIRRNNKCTHLCCV